MESNFTSEQIQKVQEYVEAQFDKNILPSLMGISSPTLLQLTLPFRLRPYPKSLQIL